MISIEEMAIFCKKKGFVYPSAEMYGGLAGFFDYGPLGVELKNNMKSSWWKFHVQNRDDVVGIDGSIITNPRVWKASGHVENFIDVMVECKKCNTRYRADHLIEEMLGISIEGAPIEEIEKQLDKIKCQNCKGDLGKAEKFHSMFETNVGPIQNEKSRAYLRPETAQLIFTNFKAVVENSRLKLPFGIAQIGKAFRNEISPRNFLFRCREFEQMEMEYFIHPNNKKCPYMKEVEEHEIQILTAEMQHDKKKEKKMKIKNAIKLFKSPWHAYWLAKEHWWFMSLGCKADNFRIRQHLPDEKAHYSEDCWDLEYNYPFGYKELQGIADRGDYDLKQHMKESKKDLMLFDEESGEKILPIVIAEPSLGVDRAFLVFMYDAYEDDKKRGNIVLKLNPKLAPIKVGVFPLVNKVGDKAMKIYSELKNEIVCTYDKGGSVGRRYARADEQGIPYCVTIDFDDGVTIRDRDSTKQIRVEEKELVSVLKRLLDGEEFSKVGKLI
ncbi:MAG: glycine--tRNA ligase [archaeon]